jgi:DNA-binding beta-propeller fold protein YncE
MRPSDGAILAVYGVGSYPGQYPTGIAYDGVYIWVANYGSGSVSKLRASDGQSFGTFPASSAGPMAFDGANMWVSDVLDWTIFKM